MSQIKDDIRLLTGAQMRHNQMLLDMQTRIEYAEKMLSEERQRSQKLLERFAALWAVCVQIRDSQSLLEVQDLLERLDEF